MQYLNNYLGQLISLYTICLLISNLYACSGMPININAYAAKEKKHYKKSDSVLLKSFAPFRRQVNKALRSISLWLVSLLAPIFARW